ncbi:succinate dehydrogenase, hydrophobic membrane anchor protein [Rhodocyclus tenuis]|uniref:Succinate dehydrogenase hydrophobic membrane anchor subunit n=1 Tax=Rhodocyclus gracilis TaxID=2929842 RepID=A0ABX0WDD7_9RHOO|nr:succinate dehydrogenase, hydrophobic membrane anchor protein [Rhodocyclus gracilis]MRD71844.1 succinate dehydrogenase, hydrophobic membrane anchor protein [Rhodocyclus gracilis]NJA87762.1 succinate dehydrogenase, hydrophobic membrane anchor protein [Rhodocyclus gracilis]
MIKRKLVGAHYGFGDWLLQRGTALVMALYATLILIIMAVVQPSTYLEWRGIFDNRIMAFLTFIYLVALFWHAWIGVRDIWLDYVKNTAVRLLLLLATLAVTIGYTGWAVQILWRV